MILRSRLLTTEQNPGISGWFVIVVGTDLKLNNLIKFNNIITEISVNTNLIIIDLREDKRIGEGEQIAEYKKPVQIRQEDVLEMKKDDEDNIKIML